MLKDNHFLRLHFVVFIFGFTAILGNAISLQAIELVFHRMWIAAVAIFIFLLVTGRTDFKLDKNAWRILLAGLIIAGHWITFFHAIKISNVSVTLACLSTGAFFGSLIEPIAFKRRIRMSEIVLGLLVILGLYLIFQFQGQFFWGIVTALISAFLSALFAVINGVLVRGNTPYRITFVEMLGGFVAIGLFLFFTGKMSTSLFALKGSDWLWLIILGVLCTAYAFLETVNLMRNISPFTFLLAVNLEPIYGILLAFWFFNDYEQLNGYFFFGAGIILSTVFIEGFIKRREKRREFKKLNQRPIL
jgi:drug/metabolite transporter (DMT)-like permease